MPREEVDLIVVGASVGGLAAAVAAADRGCRTVVVERTKDLGGGAGIEAEFIAAAGSALQSAAGVDDGPARLADDVLAATRHDVEPDMAAALAAQGAPVVAWLASRLGAAVELLRTAAPGHSVARLHAPSERGGAGLVADLSRAATRHVRVGVRTGMVAEQLLLDDAGGVSGVSVRPDRRGAVVELVGSVLLACGGFAADDALVGQHCPKVATLPYHGASGAAGEGLRLGAAVGARTVRMGSFRVTPFLAMPGQLEVTPALVGLGAILVNQAGRRFADEAGEALPLAEKIRAQPGHVAYLLFDERIATAACVADPFFARTVLPRMGRASPTLANLAKQFELDGEALALAVDTYNSNLELGGDPFGRERSGEPLAEPFQAIRVTGARCRSLGGLAVDTAARVVREDGQPVPGLYATGGAAAGLGGDGTEGALAGTDALAALGFGRLAALDVIARVAAREDQP